MLHSKKSYSRRRLDKSWFAEMKLALTSKLLSELNTHHLLKTMR